MPIDLLTRAEKGAVLTATDNDTNLTAIQTAVNANETAAQTPTLAAGALFTGSIARTVASKVSSGGMRVDIRDFAVFPNGDGDSTAGIQAALDQCPQYGVVYFPSPNANNLVSWPKYFYNLTDSNADGHCLVIPRADISLVGDQGFRLPQLRCVEAGKNLIFSEYKNISLWGLQLYGDGDIFNAGQGGTTIGFKFRGTADNADYDGFISRCAFFGHHRAADIRGRNFEYSDNIHAGCTQGLYVEPADPAANSGNADTQRGSRIYRNRFHSSGGGLWVAAVTGTCQAGSTATTLKLAAGDAGTTDLYKGRRVTLTGGTGSGQQNLIIALNATTKVATVKDAWAVTPDVTTTYSIKSEHSSASCIWIDPGAYSGTYDYGHMVQHNQADQVARFYVGTVKRSQISHNVVYNCEGGNNADSYTAIINLLAASSGEDSGGICAHNSLVGFDQDASSKGIYVECANTMIADNHIVGMQRDGIDLATVSLRNIVKGNVIAQCSGENVATYDGIRNTGTENIIINNIISGTDVGARRHRYGVNEAGVRTILGEQICASNANNTLDINVGTSTKGMVSSLTATANALSFERGDRNRLVLPTASSNWQNLCTLGGTVGTLSGVTCTAAATVTLTTVSDTSNLRKGQYVTVGADGTRRKIVAISGSTVTLSTATSASGAAQALAWAAPAFSTGGALSA